MARVAKPKPTFPPKWDEYVWPSLTVLSFDQSLANTGWSLITTSPYSAPRVRLYGTIVTEPKLTGWYDSLARGEELFDGILGVLDVVASSYSLDAVVHEMPVMMGSMRSVKQEGPPIAAITVRLAVQSHSAEIPVAMMEIKRWKKWVTGNQLADKPEIREALWKIIPPFRTNEHVADAIGIGIGAICDGKIKPKMLDSQLESAVGSQP
jgi:Holliday junction resolvasome RuvABC endonuclease subunit